MFLSLLDVTCLLIDETGPLLFEVVAIYRLH